jgi:hypothetical protein
VQIIFRGTSTSVAFADNCNVTERTITITINSKTKTDLILNLIDNHPFII